MSRTALFVDDDRLIMGRYEQAFRKNHIDVIFKHDAEDALQYIRSTNQVIDVGILDIMMPPGLKYNTENNDGLQTGIYLYRDLRTIHPNLPIVMLTNVDDPLILQAFQLDSNTIVLPKLENPPYTLVSRIESLISPSLTVNFNYDNKFACDEIVVSAKDTGSKFLSGDLYSDYFVIWWHSNISLKNFLELTKNFFKQVEVSTKSANRKVSVLKKDKEFNGATVWSREGQPLLTLPSNQWYSNINEILECAKGNNVRLIKIATDAGDMSYEFSSNNNVINQIGLISHILVNKPLADFIHSSNLISVDYFNVANLVKKISAKIKQNGA